MCQDPQSTLKATRMSQKVKKKQKVFTSGIFQAAFEGRSRIRSSHRLDDVQQIGHGSEVQTPNDGSQRAKAMQDQKDDVSP